jgi:hypothetical protein
MEKPDIPIVAKTYELYKMLHQLRGGVPKQDRHTLWQRVEDMVLGIVGLLFLAGQQLPELRGKTLLDASIQLNILRLLLRLAKDTRVIDLKRYVSLQQTVDEIGRMLGGWMRSLPHARESRGRPTG